MTDPFRHHPGLRGKIEPAEDSFWRCFHPAHLDARMAELGHPPTWRYSDDEREGYRLTAMEGRWGEDLWVFAYGSLIWNPGIVFDEVRRAHVAGFTRRFMLIDDIGGRGEPQQPGLMAALDAAKPGETGCDGLVFRIPAEVLEEETKVLWRRERLSKGYHDTFLHAQTPQGPVTALAFTADDGAECMQRDLPRAKQVEYLATGKGFLGTSLEYIQNLADHFAELRIDDPDLLMLLAEAKAYKAAQMG